MTPDEAASVPQDDDGRLLEALRNLYPGWDIEHDGVWWAIRRGGVTGRELRQGLRTAIGRCRLRDLATRLNEQDEILERRRGALNHCARP
ncbi:hypothetical protein Misp01_60750 [Microtetraspora sp. NBRC 13810]|uniref:hypothetical protein n=1 Tax=Microtetraspora sp. NBRC 13810 TaxID=3030990 RepID=UPI00249FB44C|nr:hypothetical protein [Microtetraspora sp. NBRC 13810]GLW10947.1 hypothetical protein Misp01_60750 [Microtetraspora sp. NBRC 13810]